MFGHLQLKTAYSFQQSTILIKDLVKQASSLSIDVLTIADTNNMYGTYEFYEACMKENIKPLIGVEASVSINEEIYPFLLIAKDDTGYLDLVRIVSDINLNHMSIDIKALSVYTEHILVISAYEGGIIERNILYDLKDGEVSEAQKNISLFKELFGKNYYIMIQDHGLEMQKVMNKKLISLAALTGVKVLWGNDVRYLDKKDALALDLLEASRHSSTLSQNHQPITNQKYLKDENEIKRLYPKEILDNTEEVLRMCKVSLPKNTYQLPVYPLEKGDSYHYLRELCRVGLIKRFQGKTVPQDYRERLFYELDIIHSMGFDDYFLIVFDYVRYAKKQGILVGPGRGSAAGSLVAYALGITNVDPIKYQLLFERFLNPERISMPDIDIDFQDDRRDEVIQYVIEKYGIDHASQIVTFSTYGSRVAIKDIGKVMSIPLPRLDMIAKMVPTGYRMKKTITEMYESSASFERMVLETPGMSRLIHSMSLIEHLPRNISMHAAGVVLSKNPLRDVVPLVIGPSHNLMTQYSKDYIEKAGLLKMDFLGLKYLTVLNYIMEDIRTYTGQNITVHNINMNDKKTFDLISRGDTFGVFQLESQGMRNLLTRMKPENLEDIIAAIALYRPGPMENIPVYLEARKHPEKIQYPLPELKDILRSTYGVIIYQEQIMQIATIVAGFSLGKADILRKAVSKKDSKMMLSIKNDFIEGSLEKGYTSEQAHSIFQLIEKFADYGFNKSHSVAYAYIAYQTAYFKVNYPLYFFASILSNEGSSLTTKLHCIEESKQHGVKILPPSINYSKDRFSVENNSIRYSMLAIKNVGMAVYQVIHEERQRGLFKDVRDFLVRTKGRVTIKAVESLIDAGAFDEFEKNRAYIHKNLPTLIESLQFSDLPEISQSIPVLKDVKENPHERLEKEKDVLGLYLSTHPVALVKENLHIPFVHLMDVERYINKTITVVLSISRVRVIYDKRGNEMAFVQGLDETAHQEVVCFSNEYSKYKYELERGKIVLLDVRIQKRDQISLILQKVREMK